jgi:hypothetical protein
MQQFMKKTAKFTCGKHVLNTVISKTYTGQITISICALKSLGKQATAWPIRERKPGTAAHTIVEFVPIINHIQLWL